MTNSANFINSINTSAAPVQQPLDTNNSRRRENNRQYTASPPASSSTIAPVTQPRLSQPNPGSARDDRNTTGNRQAASHSTQGVRHWKTISDSEQEMCEEGASTSTYSTSRSEHQDSLKTAVKARENNPYRELLLPQEKEKLRKALNTPCLVEPKTKGSQSIWQTFYCHPFQFLAWVKFNLDQRKPFFLETGPGKFVDSTTYAFSVNQISSALYGSTVSDLLSPQVFPPQDLDLMLELDCSFDCTNIPKDKIPIILSEKIDTLFYSARYSIEQEINKLRVLNGQSALPSDMIRELYLKQSKYNDLLQGDVAQSDRGNRFALYSFGQQEGYTVELKIVVNVTLNNGDQVFSKVSGLKNSSAFTGFKIPLDHLMKDPNNWPKNVPVFSLIEPFSEAFQNLKNNSLYTQAPNGDKIYAALKAITRKNSQWKDPEQWLAMIKDFTLQVMTSDIGMYLAKRFDPSKTTQRAYSLVSLINLFNACEPYLKNNSDKEKILKDSIINILHLYFPDELSRHIGSLSIETKVAFFNWYRLSFLLSNPSHEERIFLKMGTNWLYHIPVEDFLELFLSLSDAKNDEFIMQFEKWVPSSEPIFTLEKMKILALFTFAGRISATREAPDVAAFDAGIAPAISKEKDAADGRLAAGRKLTEKVNKAKILILKRKSSELPLCLERLIAHGSPKALRLAALLYLDPQTQEALKDHPLSDDAVSKLIEFLPDGEQELIRKQGLETGQKNQALKTLALKKSQIQAEQERHAQAKKQRNEATQKLLWHVQLLEKRMNEDCKNLLEEIELREELTKKAARKKAKKQRIEASKELRKQTSSTREALISEPTRLEKETIKPLEPQKEEKKQQESRRKIKTIAKQIIKSPKPNPPQVSKPLIQESSPPPVDKNIAVPQKQEDELSLAFAKADSLNAVDQTAHQLLKLISSGKIPKNNPYYYPAIKKWIGLASKEALLQNTPSLVPLLKNAINEGLIAQKKEISTEDCFPLLLTLLAQKPKDAISIIKTFQSKKVLSQTPATEEFLLKVIKHLAMKDPNAAIDMITSFSSYITAAEQRMALLKELHTAFEKNISLLTQAIAHLQNKDWFKDESLASFVMSKITPLIFNDMILKLADKKLSTKDFSSILKDFQWLLKSQLLPRNNEPQTKMIGKQILTIWAKETPAAHTESDYLNLKKIQQIIYGLKETTDSEKTFFTRCVIEGCLHSTELSVLKAAKMAIHQGIIHKQILLPGVINYYSSLIHSCRLLLDSSSCNEFLTEAINSKYFDAKSTPQQLLKAYEDIILLGSEVSPLDSKKRTEELFEKPELRALLLNYQLPRHPLFMNSVIAQAARDKAVRPSFIISLLRVLYSKEWPEITEHEKKSIGDLTLTTILSLLQEYKNDANTPLDNSKLVELRDILIVLFKAQQKNIFAHDQEKEATCYKEALKKGLNELILDNKNIPDGFIGVLSPFIPLLESKEALPGLSAKNKSSLFCKFLNIFASKIEPYYAEKTKSLFETLYLPSSKKPSLDLMKQRVTVLSHYLTGASFNSFSSLVEESTFSELSKYFQELMNEKILSQAKDSLALYRNILFLFLILFKYKNDKAKDVLSSLVNKMNTFKSKKVRSDVLLAYKAILRATIDNSSFRPGVTILIKNALESKVLDPEKDKELLNEHQKALEQSNNNSAL